MLVPTSSAQLSDTSKTERSRVDPRNQTRKYEQKGYSMRFWMGWVLALAWFMPAYAGNEVAFGPVPAWVRPTALPAAPTERDGSVTYLLADEQFHLEPAQQSSYAETVFRINSAEGLSYGNISLPWQPETQTLTIHRLTIRRGEQMIDVLASGQKFEVLRREANLESAMLDGRLTANIQPEDLQVGDVVTLATTVTSSDPTYRGHIEEMANAIYSMPIGRHHVSAEWPASIPIRLRQTEGLPALRPGRDGGMTRIELTTDALQPPIFPAGAPARFGRPRLIELSDFRDWSDLAELFAPLYDKATAIPADSPLQKEIARIRAASPDPRKRAEAALALVQGQVRYVALLMGTGNFVPADAALTWNRRFGDCKAKSALLVAMLRALDIAAEPVIVNASGNDGLDQRLPMIALFDHVIVRATIGGKSYWLDGTRTGDLRLDQIRTPDMDWGLPLTRGASLVRLPPEPLDKPSVETLLRIDASKGMTLAAPVHAEAIFRGDGAYGMSVSTADLTGDARDRSIRDYWKRRYAFVEVISVSSSYDPDRREQRFVMDGKAKLDWSGGVYWLVDSSLGDARADFERDRGENSDAPFTVTYPYFRRSTETVLLPPGVIPDDANIVATAAGVEYRRISSLTGNVFTVETSTRSLAAEFPASEAASAQKSIRALADRYVALRAGPDYAETAGETRQPPVIVADNRPEQEKARKPKVGAKAEQPLDGFTRRGMGLLGEMDFDGALAAFNAALEKNGSNAQALAGRGFVMAWRDDLAAATRDLDVAAVLDPNDSYVLRTRGWLAQRQKRYADALRFYTRVLQQEPDDHTTYGWRADVHHAVGDDAAAIRDSEMATKLAPGWADMYFLRAQIFQKMDQPAKAFAEARAAMAASPENSYAYYQAAIIYSEGGKRDEAMKAINRAIEIQPRADLFLGRMEMRADDDKAGKRQDIEAALRFDSSNQRALQEMASLQERSGDAVGAIATLTTALRAKPNDSELQSMRGQMLWQAGRKEEAARDFAAARAAIKDDDDLDMLCWNHAATDIDLSGATQDCQKALAKSPDHGMSLASLAQIQLNLGQIDEAIGLYGRALAIDPKDPMALYGRAAAWHRKGDNRKAQIDRAAAIKADPDIVETARRNGLTL